MMPSQRAKAAPDMTPKPAAGSEAPPAGHISRGLSSVICDRWGRGPTILMLKLRDGKAKQFTSA